VLAAWQAGSGGGGVEVWWVVSDQLGTPRMAADRAGSLAGVTRHDYLPFGEELGAGVGGRTTQQGYSQVANIRQKFTGYERDNETGLDYAQARYYLSAQGRFTSPDNFLNDTSAIDPASWNLYAYVRNNPLRYTDPAGEKIYAGGLSQADRDELLKRANYTYGCRSCVSVDKNGYLTVDTSGLSKDLLKATQFLTDAINTTSWYGEVRVSNNDSNVAFGEGRRTEGAVPFEDGSGRRRNADLIVLDFGDDQWVSGDSRAKDAFLNTVFAHEVAHFRLQPGQITRDPDDVSKTGPVVDAINEILQARGSSLRARYYSSARAGYWLEIYHGIAERDRAGNIMRNRDGGIKVKINETGNVIRWLKRNVGGKGIN
jgi:RHS repeat-associated protein